jgi:hypothetical protein
MADKVYSLPSDALAVIMMHPERRSAVVRAPDPTCCTWYRVLNGYVFSTRSNTWLVNSPGKQATMLEVVVGD